MFNPNARKTVSDYERVENTLAELTPDPRDFEEQVYPTEDVRSDVKQLDNYRRTPEYKRGGERSDAKLLEKTFTDMVERGDWFGEEEAYGDDPDYLALITFPTADIDDAFNHIDVIGMISNETTEHETMPFAIDLTYNTDNAKMAQKFRWRHVYGKKPGVPEEVSEFGDCYMDKDYYGRDVLRGRALSLKNRYGLKVPGFSSAKYFEDKNNPWDPMHDKGRIDVMPRFVVGYSTEIADVLSVGMPSEEYRKRYGEEDFLRRKMEYRNAERRAKWCTLLECREQACDIRFMLEHMDSEETKWMNPEELEKAKKQIVAMDAYFTKAVELATQKAQDDPEEMAAMNYADRDVVRQATKHHSFETYVAKGWSK
ncbi:hypothetical protein IKE71_01005 [Candidatus Saccharibacteria bacterium]|nr:hypothetical protein [Candidatus Saccharibacteria bacterium]